MGVCMCKGGGVMHTVDVFKSVCVCAFLCVCVRERKEAKLRL